MLDLFRFAIPDDKHAPTGPPQSGYRRFVPIYVSLKL